MVLQPVWRIPALTHRIAALTADIICLQEVEPDKFAALRARLGSMGYASHYERRRGGKLDGCATFYRQEFFDFAGSRVIAYEDGEGDIALVLWLHSGGRALAVANTHVAWEPPDVPFSIERRRRKIRQLLAECKADAHQAWIVCGDMNTTPDSKLIAAFRRAGFEYAHHRLADVYTCNVNGEAKMIDYLFHSPALKAEPEPLPPISDRMPLPSAAEPSDHLPVVARFFWTG
jgi:endonuclease/exonuclease/phosphatase family metal-dependent hydrolase